MPRARKSARYTGQIRYVRVFVRNRSPDKMREKVDALPFLAYHVETLKDGRKVCITKPGTKPVKLSMQKAQQRASGKLMHFF